MRTMRELPAASPCPVVLPRHGLGASKTRTFAAAGDVGVPGESPPQPDRTAPQSHNTKVHRGASPATEPSARGAQRVYQSLRLKTP
jgi:hypothetical protein